MAQSQHRGDASVSALTGFGRYWLIAVAAALVSAIAANMFIGVKLGLVVEVLLAIMLFALALAEVYFVIRAVGFLIAGRASEAMLWFGAMVIYLLLLFPPLLAFDAYAWFTGQEIAGSSHLYDSVTGSIASFFKFPAQLISAGMVLVLNAGSAYVNYVAQARTALEIGANLLSILVALRALLARRDHKRETDH